MIDDKFLSLRDGETVEDFLIRLGNNKDDCGMTWSEVADLVNNTFNLHKAESTYRKWFTKNRDCCGNDDYEYSLKYSVGQCVQLDDEVEAKILELQKERIRLADERSQYNSFLRRMSREETLKDIAKSSAEIIAEKKPFLNRAKIDTKKSNEAILLISDVHYGIEFENHINRYNPDVCLERINVLLSEVIDRCDRNNVKKLYLMDLGDLISGRIHTQIRIQNRCDVITQVIEISEIMAEFINTLTETMVVEYHSCADNHSRVEPIKENSLSLEQLSRITPWYIKARLKDNQNVIICDNEVSEDIITFNTKYHSIAGVHGDKDKPSNMANILSTFTHKDFDLICSAHLHHHTEDEQNMVDIICNGSIMGVDDFAHSLRASSRPSQTLIIPTENNVRDTVYKIVLD